MDTEGTVGQVISYYDKETNYITPLSSGDDDAFTKL